MMRVYPIICRIVNGIRYRAFLKRSGNNLFLRIDKLGGILIVR